MIKLQTSNTILGFDAADMRLRSLRAKSVPELEFIEFSEKHPAFEIGYYDERNRYRLADSFSASEVKISHVSGSGCTTVFSGINGFDIRVTCRVTVDPKDDFARFGISVENNCGLVIADVRYPFIVCPYKLSGTGKEAVVVPQGYGSGQLLTGDLKYGEGKLAQRLVPDSSAAWEICPREGECMHYPGLMYAQFLAYYNDSAGIYMACDDTSAYVKRFKVLHRKPGMRLGVSHIGDWPETGQRDLEYSTVVTAFTGDWYDAADIYRNWSMKQWWFVSLAEKENVPEWLKESPAYITVRPAGILDIGEVNPIDDFLPYEKCLPMLDNISEKINSPVCVIFMGWERAGSWVYPDCFPPVGGEGSFVNTIKMIKERGWRAGSFNSGTRWCGGQAWGEYDGIGYLDSIGAYDGICKTADGNYWAERWCENWRPSYTGCMGTDKTRKAGYEIIEKQIGWGMEALQYLDQNFGAATMPCFAGDHGHPPMPGKWMYEHMKEFMECAHSLAAKHGGSSVIHSAEAGLNEVCLPLFQQTELRVYPSDYGTDDIPLYQYLFHECVAIQGMMGFAPEPYHTVIKNAVNFIYGAIPGGCLKGDGTFLDKDTDNWALWEPKSENFENGLTLIKNIIEIRKGIGRDFLLFGRMIRPSETEGIERVKWVFDNKENDYASVFHSAWQAQDGRLAVVLVNWTEKARKVRVKDKRFSMSYSVISKVNGNVNRDVSNTAIINGLELLLPPFGCAVLAQYNS